MGWQDWDTIRTVPCSVAEAMNADPQGEVAADLEEALLIAERQGVVPLLRRALDDEHFLSAHRSRLFSVAI